MHTQNSLVCIRRWLQNVLRRVENAYENFFRRRSNYPRFKKFGCYRTLTWPQIADGMIGKHSIKLPKFGRVRIVKHRPIRGEPKTVTLVSEESGEWYLCVVVEQQDCLADRPTVVRNPVGVDSGLINYLYLSNGLHVTNPKFVKGHEKRIRKAQKEFSRKAFMKKIIIVKDAPKVVTYPSKNRLKAKRRLAGAWQRYKNAKDDWQWKTARGLVDAHDFIAYEDLSLRNMIQNRNLARSLQDAALGSFWAKTEHIAARLGTRTQMVPPRYTTQECSRCHQRQKVSLSERTYRCISCGYFAARDRNSSQVIEQLGLEAAGVTVISNDGTRMDVPGMSVEAGPLAATRAVASQALAVKQETSSHAADEPATLGRAAREAHSPRGWENVTLFLVGSAGFEPAISSDPEQYLRVDRYPRPTSSFVSRLKPRPD